MNEGPHRPSPLALVLLGLLSEEPMHAYRMRRLIKERGKDSVVNVERSNSVYQTIDRLHRAELIRVRATSRVDGRPDRTTYEITDSGRAALRRWLAAGLARPAREFPEFPAALATLAATTPEEARHHLAARASALAERLADLRSRYEAEADTVPRLFLIEVEYTTAMLDAELTWVRALLADLDHGGLTWTRDWIDTVRSALGAGDPHTCPDPR
jgi:DNA-binding PadR family transcriptional regulator